MEINIYMEKLAVSILQTNYLSIDELKELDLLPSLSASGIKTVNRRIYMRHNFLRLVIHRFRRTKCSDEFPSVAFACSIKTAIFLQRKMALGKDEMSEWKSGLIY